MVASEQQEPCCPRYSLASHGTAILTSLVVCGSRGITNFNSAILSFRAELSDSLVDSLKLLKERVLLGKPRLLYCELLQPMFLFTDASSDPVAGAGLGACWFQEKDMFFLGLKCGSMCRIYQLSWLTGNRQLLENGRLLLSPWRSWFGANCWDGCHSWFTLTMRVRNFFDQGLFQLTIYNGYMCTSGYVPGPLLYLTLVQQGSFFVEFGWLSLKAVGPSSFKKRFENPGSGSERCLQRKHEFHWDGKDATINMGGGRGESGRHEFPIV